MYMQTAQSSKVKAVSNMKIMILGHSYTTPGLTYLTISAVQTLAEERFVRCAVCLGGIAEVV